MPLFDPAAVAVAARNDDTFKLATMFLSGKVRINIGDDSYLLVIRDGQFVDFTADEGSEPVDVTFSNSAEAWEKLLAAEDTPPGHGSPLFMDPRCAMRVDGDIIEGYGPLSRAIYEFFRVLRNVVLGRVSEDLLPEVEREFDSVVGRYTYVRVEGIQYRVYYEEAGHGSIPLLLQHTAGADTRQYRHILEDPDFQKNFRMIAYDLPFHGKSLPPSSHKWWDKPYKVTKSFLLEFVGAFSERLGLDRPVFLGSALGGMLALDLAYYHPDKVRAVIALNAALALNPHPAVNEMMATFTHPRVGRQWHNTMMLANIAGSTPEVYRRELSWVYYQGGPATMEGAVNYYFYDHCMTAEQAAQIDTEKVKVYLFNGVDDSQSGGSLPQELAAAMPTAPFKFLRRLGHFGAAENPEAFKEDLWPTFEEIIAHNS